MFKDIHNNWISRPRLVCGLMTGTSVDAVDVALCRFSVAQNRFSYDLIAFDCLEIPIEIKKLINRTITEKVSIREISLLNSALAHLYTDSIKHIAQKAKIELSQIEAIGTHGQTLWHFPDGDTLADISIPHTFQAGSGSYLAVKTGIPVISDFRTADIALEGQGAPLAPIFDYHFLRDENHDTIALNIGGISNITYMKADCKKDEVIAFDTGPGNTLIDYATSKYFGLAFDKNGEIARKGSIISSLFDKLKDDNYITRRPPKSTGREKYNPNYLNKIYAINEKEKKEDLIRTLTEFTAWSIAENIRLFANPSSKIMVSGGGSNNLFLIELLHLQTLNQYLLE